MSSQTQYGNKRNSQKRRQSSPNRQQDDTYEITESENIQNAIVERQSSSTDQILPPAAKKMCIQPHHHHHHHNHCCSHVESFSIFGHQVACHLSHLPLSVALKSQAFIQNYLIQQRLKILSNGNDNISNDGICPIMDVTPIPAPPPEPESPPYYISKN